MLNYKHLHLICFIYLYKNTIVVEPHKPFSMLNPLDLSQTRWFISEREIKNELKPLQLLHHNCDATAISKDNLKNIHKGEKHDRWIDIRGY